MIFYVCSPKDGFLNPESACELDTTMELCIFFFDYLYYVISSFTLLDYIYIKHKMFGADTPQTNAKVCSLITTNPALAHTDWYRLVLRSNTFSIYKIPHKQYRVYLPLKY